MLLCHVYSQLDQDKAYIRDSVLYSASIVSPVISQDSSSTKPTYFGTPTEEMAHATATFNGKTIAETDSYKLVEGNIYVRLRSL